ncbi:MFS transporter [Amycolatopsis dendrobii]|uniref:MFS transporter n=1 Tax=Amycolatopsis dendrobii TaxID=2760662 RepID=UPI001C71B84A|nr:MFS transporter [Amycolatopsis dendrobii]
MLLTAPGRPWLILVSTALAGLTVGFGLTGAMNIVVATVPEDRTASVSGLVFVVKSIGGALGAQLGAVLLAQSTAPAAETPAWAGFQSAFLLAAGVSLAAVLLSIALPARLPRAATAIGEPA